MAEIPPLRLSGIKPTTKRNASPWSEASAENKNAWAKAAIDHLLINKSYITTQSLMDDMFFILQSNALFNGRSEDSSHFRISNPGIENMAQEALKAVNPSADKSAPASTAKSGTTPEAVKLEKAKKTNTLIIVVAVVIAFGVVAFMFLKKK
jgi:hypothetical protein